VYFEWPSSLPFGSLFMQGDAGNSAIYLFSAAMSPSSTIPYSILILANDARMTVLLLHHFIISLKIYIFASTIAGLFLAS
jgi:hypothetical protein